MTKLADAGIFAAADREEDNSNEEVLEMDEQDSDKSGNTDGNSGANAVPQRHYRR